MTIWTSHLAAESRTLLRFATTGILATLVHMTTALWLLGVPNASVMAANTIAFFTAFSVSFIGNYLWTFRVHGHFRRSLIRYLVVAGTAFLANSLGLTSLLTIDRLDPRAAIVLSAAIVPLCTFALSRLWAFKEHAVSPGSK